MLKLLLDIIHKNKIIDTVITSYNFRTVVFSAISFVGNIAYAVFNIFVAGFSHSLWCGALACYHTSLVFLRGYILINYYKSYKINRKDSVEQTLVEMKQYRLCGIIFLMLTLCLAAIVLLIVRAEKVFEYDLYMIYIIAGYTLFQIVVAIINYIKAHKNDNYMIRSLRCINLTAALVSFLSLQAIALDTFSTNVNIPLVNALTGFVVCGVIVANGVYIVVKSTTRIKELQSANWKNWLNSIK